MNYSSINSFIKNISRYDPEDVDVAVLKLIRVGSDIDLDLLITTEKDTQCVCQIKCLRVRAYSLNSYSFSEIALLSEHPLLWRYSDVSVSLYFNGQPTDRYRLISDLMSVHGALFSNMLPLDFFLNSEIAIQELLTRSFGFFVRGPKKLMEKYAECFMKNGVEYSFVGESEPRYWNGTSFVSGIQHPEILLVGEIFVIADSFELLSSSV